MQERKLKYVILMIKLSCLPPPTTTKNTPRINNGISCEPSLPQLFLNGLIDASKLQNLYNGLMIHFNKSSDS